MLYWSCDIGLVNIGHVILTMRYWLCDIGHVDIGQVTDVKTWLKIVPLNPAR